MADCFYRKKILKKTFWSTNFYEPIKYRKSGGQIKKKKTCTKNVH